MSREFLLLGIVVGFCGYWVWGYQRRTVGVLQSVAKPPTSVVGGAGTGGEAAPTPAVEECESPDPTPLISDAEPEVVEGELMTAPGTAVSADAEVAGEQLDRNSQLVLRWGQFLVISVVALDGVAIVACRACHRKSHRPSRRRLPSVLARNPSVGPRLLTTDQTLVLLIGDGEQARTAEALLDQWRQDSTVLWLRPTATPGKISVHDDRQSSLRAVVLAA